INKIHVGMPGRAEEDGIARSAPGVSMRRRVLNSEVGFVFDDTATEYRSSFGADQQLAQQLASHGHRIATEEFERKYLSTLEDRSREGGGWLGGLLGGCVAIRHRRCPRSIYNYPA